MKHFLVCTTSMGPVIGLWQDHEKSPGLVVGDFLGSEVDGNFAGDVQESSASLKSCTDGWRVPAARLLQGSAFRFGTAEASRSETWMTSCPQAAHAI